MCDDGLKTHKYALINEVAAYTHVENILGLLLSLTWCMFKILVSKTIWQVKILGRIENAGVIKEVWRDMKETRTKCDAFQRKAYKRKELIIFSPYVYARIDFFWLSYMLFTLIVAFPLFIWLACVTSISVLFTFDFIQCLLQSSPSTIWWDISTDVKRTPWINILIMIWIQSFET